MPNVARSIGVLSLLAMLLATACSGDRRADGESPASPPTLGAGIVADAEPYEGPTQQVHLFTDRREVQADIYRSLPPEPPSPFPAWDGSSVVIYDLETNEVLYDLGEGNLGMFSRDGRWFAWTSGPSTLARGADLLANEAWVLDLETGERRSFGRAQLVSFPAEGQLRISNLSRPDGRLFDLDTGEDLGRSDRVDPSFPILDFPGYRIERRPPDIRQSADVHWLIIPDGASRALRIDAPFAIPLNRNEVLVMTTPAGGSMNLFRVRVPSGDAVFVGTAFGTEEQPALFGGLAGQLAWTNHRCDAERGRTRIFDYETGLVTELDRALWLAIAVGPAIDDSLTLGFAALVTARLDLESLQYTLVLPSFGVLSLNGAYAAVGRTFLTGAQPNPLLCDG